MLSSREMSITDLVDLVDVRFRLLLAAFFCRLGSAGGVFRALVSGVWKASPLTDDAADWRVDVLPDVSRLEPKVLRTADLGSILGITTAGLFALPRVGLISVRGELSSTSDVFGIEDAKRMLLRRFTRDADDGRASIDGLGPKRSQS